LKRLVTEREVLELSAGSRLVLPQGALVTPAARDAALVRGVELVEKRSSGAPPPAGPGPTLAGLPDGEYLVELRGGKARIRRVERG